MKFFSVILSFFVLLNVLAPMPTHDCASHETQQTENNETTSHKSCCSHNSTDCSSNSNQSDNDTHHTHCECGCSAIISIIPKTQAINVAYFNLQNDQFIYIENKKNNKFHTIWHPPQA